MEWYFGGTMLSPAQKTFPTQVSVLQITKGEKRSILQFGHKKQKTLAKLVFSHSTADESCTFTKTPHNQWIVRGKKKRAQPKLAKVVSDDINCTIKASYSSIMY